jgi:hypothetical protein
MIIDHDKQGMQGTQQEDAVAKSHETTQARTPTPPTNLSSSMHALVMFHDSVVKKTRE